MSLPVIATERALTRTYCKSIVIVGAGFCGTMLTVHLLRANASHATHITLIEQNDFARGVAFANRDFPYLLNVPASRMSACSDQPQQFLEFARSRNPLIGGGDYLPRSMYGDYLQSLLADAERAALPRLTLSRMHGHVKKVIPLSRQEGIRIELASGTALFADELILATGNPPSRSLPGAEFLLDHPGYSDSPWHFSAENHHWRKVLVVGTGLSMADTFLRLHTSAHPPQVHALSRHGLLPQSQSDSQHTALRGASERLLANADSLRALTRATRTLIDAGNELGGDWRPVINLLRALTPVVWSSLPAEERRRFVRHIQPYWDAHRHRLPPIVAKHINQARRNGHLLTHAGRIRSLQPLGKQLKVTWQPRGESQSRDLIVDAVINATGPNYCVRTTGDTLLRTLHNDGLIAADEANLGILTTADGELVDTRGHTHANIFYLGPLLRASYWEATAVAELRDHAKRLADLLVARNRTANQTTTYLSVQHG
jgi:uncharacterized NAD(P)/FAD-binding protein YdhS